MVTSLLGVNERVSVDAGSILPMVGQLESDPFFVAPFRFPTGDDHFADIARLLDVCPGTGSAIVRRVLGCETSYLHDPQLRDRRREQVDPGSIGVECRLRSLSIHRGTRHSSVVRNEFIESLFDVVEIIGIESVVGRIECA